MINIKAKMAKLKGKLSKCLDEIEILRYQCTHPVVMKKANSNSGNYDPSADSYWYEFTCEECGARWDEDQDVYNERNRAEGWAWEKQRTIINE